MPVTKYRTLAARGTRESYETLFGLLLHLGPFASELKGLTAVGQPSSGYVVEVSEPIPAAQEAHLGVLMIG